MSKVVCIPDTSAYWHLKEIIVGGKDIRSWLGSEFEVWLTEAILNEIRHNRKSLKVTQGTLNQIMQCPVENINLRQTVRDTIGRLVDSTISNFDDEELSCVVLGLHLLLQRQSDIKHVIILSDDFKAFESEQARRLRSAIPSLCFWNSADFVLYLALRLAKRERPDLSLIIFQEALYRALYNSSPMSQPVTEQVRNKWLIRFENYRKWLDRAFMASKFNW